MKFKDKIKSYSFWVSLASAIILILKILGSRFGFSVDETFVSDLFTALCSILVLLGIIVIPTTNQSSNNNQTNLSNNLKIETLDSQENKTVSNCANNITEDLKDEQLISSETTEAETQNKVNQSVCETETSNIIDLSNKPFCNADSSASLSSLNNETESCNQNLFSENNFISETTASFNNLNEISEIKTEGILSDLNIVSESSTEQAKNNFALNDETIQKDKTINISNTFSNDLKTLLTEERNKFAGNLDAYIFELQEEIRKTREGM